MSNVEIEYVRKLKGFNEGLSRYQDPEIHLRACLNNDMTFIILRKHNRL